MRDITQMKYFECVFANIFVCYAFFIEKHIAKTPFVFSASEGERVTKPASPKPDSFEQAKQVVLDLLS